MSTNQTETHQHRGIHHAQAIDAVDLQVRADDTALGRHVRRADRVGRRPRGGAHVRLDLRGVVDILWGSAEGLDDVVLERRRGDEAVRGLERLDHDLVVELGAEVRRVDDRRREGVCRAYLDGTAWRAG